MVASLERARLGLGDGPLADLMEILVVEVGLRVFRMEMPSDISAIYAYTQAHGGCIAVNSVLPLEPARLRMAEGYGRYLLDRLEAGVTRHDHPVFRKTGRDDRFSTTRRVPQKRLLRF